MDHGFPESDWKVFRALYPGALDRFSKSVLDELKSISGDFGRTHHERYLAIYVLLQKRDKQLARLFDNPRRSQMLRQLDAIWSYGLLNREELDRFSESTQKFLGVFVQD